jgi:hypothetical protein
MPRASDIVILNAQFPDMIPQFEPFLPPDDPRSHCASSRFRKPKFQREWRLLGGCRRAHFDDGALLLSAKAVAQKAMRV